MTSISIFKKPLVIVGSFLFSLTLFFNGLCQAQDASFSISPAYPDASHSLKFNFELKPGERTESFLKLSNPSSQTVTLHLYGTDSLASADGKIGFKTAAENQTLFGTWLKFDRTDITLLPQTTQDLKFELNIPTTAEKKDYLGGIVAENRGNTLDQAGNNNGIAIHSRIVLNAYLKVTDFPQLSPNLFSQTSGSWTQIYFICSALLLILAAILLLISTFSNLNPSKKP